jgi:hypothetical protein
VAAEIDISAEDVWAALLRNEVAYYGASICALEYGRWRGEPFRWLWLDEQLLAVGARHAGLSVEPVVSSDDEYVARVFSASERES